MLKLRLTGKFKSADIISLEEKTFDSRPCGMTELFAELAQLGHCKSCNASRIYYLAYLLSENYPLLEFAIEKGE